MDRLLIYIVAYQRKSYTTGTIQLINEVNNIKYEKYKNLAKNLPNVYFGGRLAEYKYYDMDKVIKSALNFVKNIIKKNKIH